MDSAALERQLRAARSYEQWVTAVAAVFAAHGLVFGHGTDNAGDEAFWLVRHLQQWDDAAWRRSPDAALIPAAVELVRRRVVERAPLAYLLHEAWFAGLCFYVDERVLVPRSPLAEVIERGFAPWCDVRPGDRVLDIGTGSGCLAIAAAVHWPELTVDATDWSAAALAVARTNAERHAVGKLRLFEADLFPAGSERYRVILSNPPYVPAGEVAELPPEYRHEPAVALAGGENGFAAVDRILREAPARLASEGVLFMEVGGGATAFASAYPELPVVWLELERGGEGVFMIGAAELGGAFR